MAGVLRNIIRKVGFFITILCCIAYFVACLVPFLNPATWWFAGFLGLLFPYLATILLFAVILWLIIKPRYTLLPLIALLISYKQLQVLFALHPYNNFKAAKSDTCLRIVDWNVGNMYGLSSNNDKRKHNRLEIANAILKLEPDIICLQEFNHSETQGTQADNISLFSAKYPYYFFSKDVNRKNGYYQYGSIIFSRRPIVGSGRIPFPHYSSESLIYADLQLQEDTIRVYTSHLQSFKFSGEDYEGIEHLKEQDEDAMAASRNLIQKMKIAFKRRGTQTDVVNKEISKSPHPSVVCGDFNDVPNSYTYFQIRGLRQDAFLAKDFGIGKSFNAIAPTLRIDYILPDTTFGVKQFDMVDEDLSDHSMLVSDIYLRK